MWICLIYGLIICIENAIANDSSIERDLQQNTDSRRRFSESAKFDSIIIMRDFFASTHL